jgi:hypothetical protein
MIFSMHRTNFMLPRYFRICNSEVAGISLMRNLNTVFLRLPNFYSGILFYIAAKNKNIPLNLFVAVKSTKIV